MSCEPIISKNQLTCINRLLDACEAQGADVFGYIHYIPQEIIEDAKREYENIIKDAKRSKS